MGRRCCVDGCKSNQGKSKAKDAALKARNDKKFEGRQNIPLFGLPSKKRSNEERKRWIKSIPRLTEADVEKLKENAAVCVKHWPANFPTIKGGNGEERPANPPSIFDGFHPSEIPSAPPPLPPPRPTKRTSSEIRTFQPDEMEEFKKLDLVDFQGMKNALINSKEFCVPTTNFAVGDEQWIQSNEFVSGCQN